MHDRDTPSTPQFCEALEQLLRQRVRQRANARRVRTPVAVALVAAGALALPLLTPGRGDDATQAHATGFRFSDGRSVAAAAIDNRRELDELVREASAAGVEIVVKERPVAPRADGRLFTIAYPDGARLDRKGRLMVESETPSPIVVTVGRGVPGERAGLTVYEAIPRLCSLVDPSDAPGTARALRDAGFEPVFSLVHLTGGHGDNRAENIEEPPPGTVVISVLGRNGDITDVDPQTRELLVEVGQPGEGHHGAGPACAAG